MLESICANRLKKVNYVLKTFEETSITNCSLILSQLEMPIYSNEDYFMIVTYFDEKIANDFTIISKYCTESDEHFYFLRKVCSNTFFCTQGRLLS